MIKIVIRYAGKMSLVLLLPLVLAACQVMPYQRQALQTPAHWQEASGAASSVAVVDGNWWDGFADPALRRVLAQARQHNPDLAVVLGKVYRAQLDAGLAGSEATPSLTGSVAGEASRQVGRAADWGQIWNTRIGSSYELDLWGRLAASQRRANEAFIASRYDAQAACLLLESTAAKLYWEIASLKTRIALSEAHLADSRQIVALTRSRREAGAIDEQNLLQAERALLFKQNTLRQQQAWLVQQQNALSVLLDQAPGQPLPEIPPLVTRPVIPAIPTGLPSSLLARRPDLMAAEARLRATLAQVDQQRAEFFPKFALTGSLGTSSVSLANILQNPALMVGAGLELPFLQWNKQKLRLKASQADYDIASIQFRKDLYTAYREVDDALTARVQLADNSQRQQAILALSQRNALLTHRRYLAGAIDMQAWLQARQELQHAENSLLQIGLDRLDNLATLYRALGGPPAEPVRPSGQSASP